MSVNHQESLATRKEPSNDPIQRLARRAARQGTTSHMPVDPEWEQIMASAEGHKSKYGFYPWENDIPEDEQERIAEEGAKRFQQEQTYIRAFKRKHGITPDEWEHRQAMRACPSYRKIVLKRAGIDSTKLLSIEQVAKLLKLSAKTVRNKVAAGTFPVKAHRVQGKTRFFAADVVEYLCEEREAFLDKPLGLAEKDKQGSMESLERDTAKAEECGKGNQSLQPRARENIDHGKSAQESLNNR